MNVAVNQPGAVGEASGYLGRGFRGYTLLELIVVVAMVLTLLGVVVPLTSTYMNRAKKAKCLSHMRTIHSGIMSYIQEVGHWPQMDAEKWDHSEEEFFEFWVTITEDHGLNRDTWLCPSDRALERRLLEEKAKGKDKGKYMGSYIPTRFDEHPATPFRWNQPWVIERGGFHGKGPHVLMPDGSIQESLNPFNGR